LPSFSSLLLWPLRPHTTSGFERDGLTYLLIKKITPRNYKKHKTTTLHSSQHISSQLFDIEFDLQLMHK